VKERVSICTMIHNEGYFIEEWIAYHLLIGVDHFYIYNDESTDDIADILAKYIELGIVSLIPWNHSIQTVDPALVEYEPQYTRPQRFAIADCLINHKKESEYFGIWDMDEFAVLNDSFADINTFLRFNDQTADDYEIPTTTFGSSGYNTTPNALVIDTYLMRSKYTVFGMNPDDRKFSGKSLYKSGCGLPNVHHTAELVRTEQYACRKTVRNGWIIAVENRAQMGLTINHYAVKSWEHYKAKAEKWHFDLDRTIFDKQLAFGNIVCDETLTRFVPAVKGMLRCMGSRREFNY